MKTPRLHTQCLACIMLLIMAAPAQSALFTRLGGQAVYDDQLNITWLADANLAESNTFGTGGISGGAMNWNTANNWLSNMNASSYLGFNDWRMPHTQETDPTCSAQNNPAPYSNGFNCSGSEMGHLYYSDMGGNPSSIYIDESWGPFINIDNHFYWSGTTYSGHTPFAWTFNFNDGGQGSSNSKDSAIYRVWAVRNGDVAAVPEPSSVALILAGLLGLAGLKRKRY